MTLPPLKGEIAMRASTPEEIERLFPESMRRGELDAALACYAPALAFWKRENKVNVGIESLREELAPLASEKAEFRFINRRVVGFGLTLIYDEWRAVRPREKAEYVIEIVWRPLDKSWTFAAGDPFAVMSGSAS